MGYKKSKSYALNRESFLSNKVRTACFRANEIDIKRLENLIEKGFGSSISDTIRRLLLFAHTNYEDKGVVTSDHTLNKQVGEFDI